MGILRSPSGSCRGIFRGQHLISGVTVFSNHKLDVGMSLLHHFVPQEITLFWFGSRRAQKTLVHPRDYITFEIHNTEIRLKKDCACTIWHLPKYQRNGVSEPFIYQFNSIIVIIITFNLSIKSLTNFCIRVVAELVRFHILLVVRLHPGEKWRFHNFLVDCNQQTILTTGRHPCK